MSGHSKWHKVKHRKAATDKQKSKSFGRFSREIKVAARAGKDPNTNAALRDAIERAKKANLPQVNIDRLLDDSSDTQESVMYEGYGAGGVALLVAAETDNTNRTVAELRSVFKKNQGTLGEAGSVKWKFSESVTIEATLPSSIDKDELELTLIDAGASEIDEHEGALHILGPLSSRGRIEKILKEKSIPITESFATHTVSGNQRLDLTPEQTIQLETLTTALTDHPDVIDVYTDAAVE